MGIAGVNPLENTSQMTPEPASDMVNFFIFIFERDELFFVTRLKKVDLVSKKKNKPRMGIAGVTLGEYLPDGFRTKD